MESFRARTIYFSIVALIVGACLTICRAQSNNGPAPKTAPAASPAAEAPNDFLTPRGEDRSPLLAGKSGAKLEKEMDSTGTAGLLLRTAGALLLILGSIAVIAWGLRRYGGGHFGSQPVEAPELAVLSSISIGERRTLTAVRFGDRLLLIGSTAQSITLLADEEIRPQKVVRGRSVAELLNERETPGFRQVLARVEV
jgi:flagellar biosynthetic protein FliO